MSTTPSAQDDARQCLDREADLVDRFAEMYRSRLSQLVVALNAGGACPASADPIRHCVEAVDMVLASHAEFARSLKRLARDRDHEPLRRAA